MSFIEQIIWKKMEEKIIIEVVHPQTTGVKWSEAFTELDPMDKKRPSS